MRYINLDADGFPQGITEIHHTFGGVLTPQRKVTLKVIEAEVQPVVHAKILSWKDRHDSFMALYTCSNCEKGIVKWDNFCPKCGAIIDKDGDNNNC